MIWVSPGGAPQGFLESWRRDGDSWLAYVRYMVGPGVRHLTWVSAERVRVPL
jgi:hypothetical protein